MAGLGETAHLSVLDGDAVVTLLSESSPSAVQATGWTGRAVPAYCTSAGRALLPTTTRTPGALLGAASSTVAAQRHATSASSPGGSRRPRVG